MNFPADIWAEKRKNGLVRYLLVDGIVFTGGAFAVVMQIIGVFLLREEGQTIGQYFTATRTWVTFLLHGTLFGLIGGFIRWRRNEAAFAASTKAE
jgi:uncharacterized membrane protein